MFGFPVGMIGLVAVTVLIYFGLAQRVLDRLRLSDRAALLAVAAAGAGSFVDLPLTGGRPAVSLNVGALVAVGLAVYLLVKAGTRKEVVRALAAAGATAAVVFLLNGVLGRGDPWQRGIDLMDPLFLYPLVAGGTASLVGRSRRTAFIAAVLGVLALDVADVVRLAATGTPGAAAIGGAGIFDVLVLSGLAAVLLAEVTGELRERLQGGVATAGRPPALLRGLRRPRPGVVARKPERGGEGR